MIIDYLETQNCHPERSEGSGLSKREILRCAQNDILSFGYFISGACRI
jgi:hypothetical protein